MAVVVPGVEEALNGGAEGGQIVKDADRASNTAAGLVFLATGVPADLG